MRNKNILLGLGVLVFYNLSLALENGHCISIPDSKQYLDSFKAEARKPSFQQTNPKLAAIVENLQDNESVKYYFCRMECQAQGRISSIWTQLSEAPSRHEAMDGFLCPAVSIENVHIVGSIYSPQPVAHEFPAYSSSLLELKEWLEQINFTLNEAEYQANREAMDKIFKQVGVAFVTANSPIFQKAGLELLEIANHSDFGQSLLESYLLELASLHWNLKLDYSRSESLVLQQISLHGRFLQFYN